MQIKSRYINSNILIASAIFLLLVIKIVLLFKFDYTALDESYWIAASKATLQSDNSFWTLLHSSLARPGTLLFLIIFIKLTFIKMVVLPKIVALFYWCFTLIFIYKTISLFLDKTSAQATIFFVFVISIFNLNPNFISYNSEIPSLFCFSVIIYLMAKNIVANLSSLQCVLLGFLLGLSPFIKMQNVPIGLVLGVFVLFHFILKRQFKFIALFSVFCLIPLLFIIGSYYYYGNGFEQFYTEYISYYKLYSFSTSYFSTMPYTQRFSFLRILNFSFLQGADFNLLIIAGIFIYFLLILLFIFKKSIFSSNSIKFLAIILVLYPVSWYCVLQAGNDFGHYLYYVVFISIFLIAYFTHALLVKINTKIIVSSWILYILALLIVHASIPWYLKNKDPDKAKKVLLNHLNQYNNQNTKAVFWGNLPEMYVLGNFKIGCSEADNYFIVTRPKGSEAIYLNKERIFINDIQTIKPDLIVDVNHPYYNKRSDSLNRITNFNTIYLAIQKQYYISDTFKNEIIYSRK